MTYGMQRYETFRTSLSDAFWKANERCETDILHIEVGILFVPVHSNDE